MLHNIIHNAVDGSEIRDSPVDMVVYLIISSFTRFGLHPRCLFGICEPTTVATPIGSMCGIYIYLHSVDLFNGKCR